MNTLNLNILSTSTLKGTEVKNPGGKNLGDIKDIMIDLDTGRIAYMVLSFGGFLGIGDKYFAVPLEALTIDKEDNKFIMDVSKEKLENAPGFDKDNWPTNPDQRFINDIHTYYGYKPFYQRDVEMA